MKKAIITILGRTSKIDENERANYYFEKTLKNRFTIKKSNYTNMFPLLIDNFSDFDIVPIFTTEAKNTNIEVLKDENIAFNDFKDDFHIDIDEPYDNVLKIMNSALSQYDEVIFDMTHGFRHLPILATIALITKNIQDKDKIQDIIFAKEIEFKKKYEIISLLEYLDLANLSFLLANFKDNYTVSKHIQIKSLKYKNLIKSMNKFSSDVMSLSLENLLDNSARKLTDEIGIIIDVKDTILIDELKALQKHIRDTFYKRDNRYETYYHIAEELFKKGYLVHALSLIFEAISFYLKISIENYNEDLKIYIKDKENKIKLDKELDYYKLTTACSSFIFFEKNSNTNHFFTEKQINLIYKNIDNIDNIGEFKKFASKVKKLRNNLLHANSGNQLNNTQNDIKTVVDEYKQYCIEDNMFYILKKEKSKRPNISAIIKPQANQPRGLRIVKKKNASV